MYRLVWGIALGQLLATLLAVLIQLSLVAALWWALGTLWTRVATTLLRFADCVTVRAALAARRASWS